MHPCLLGAHAPGEEGRQTQPWGKLGLLLEEARGSGEGRVSCEAAPSMYSPDTNSHVLETGARTVTEHIGNPIGP